MVQLNTNYDSVLHEKVFILKGEEAYARTTDCILTEITHPSGTGVDPDTGRLSDWNHYLTSFAIELKVEVLRNLDASTIVLYDNDTVVATAPYNADTECVEWKYVDASHDNRIRLAYDIDHNFYVKYMGNKKCLKSESKKYSLNVETPDNYVSTLSFTGLNNNYNHGGTLSFTVTLSADDSSYVSGQSIKIYHNNTLVNTYTTGNNGTTETITISGLTDGLKNIQAVYDGSDYLTVSQASKNVSVGYKLSMELPSYFNCNGGSYVVKGTVTDYHDYHVINGTVTATFYAYSSSYSYSKTATTNGDGVATITLSNSDYGSHLNVGGSESNLYTKIAYGGNETSYQAKPILYTQMGDLTATTPVSNGFQSIVTGKINNYTDASYSTSTTLGVQLPIAITNGGVNVGTVNTDTNGNFTYTYNGEGVGNVTIGATLDSLSKTVGIEDLVQYWNRNTIYNQQYIVFIGKMSKVSNGFKLESSSNNYSCIIGLGTPDDQVYWTEHDGNRYQTVFPNKLEFDVITAPQSSYLLVGGHDGISTISNAQYSGSLTAGSHVTIESDGLDIVVKIGTTVTLSKTLNEGYTLPLIVISGGVVIDNLKWGKV